MPLIGNDDDYCRWMTDAGLNKIRYHDWTSAVEPYLGDLPRPCAAERSARFWLAKWMDRPFAHVLDRLISVLQSLSDRNDAIRRVCVEKPVAGHATGGADRWCVRAANPQR